MVYLRAAAVNISKFLYKETANGDYEGVSGSDFALLQVICTALKMKLMIVKQETPDWGKRLENGTWTGMIQMLIRNEADVILDALSPSVERMEVVDFTFPYVIDKEVFAIKRAGMLSKKFVYLYPFQLQLWVAAVFAFLSSSLLLSIILRQNKKDISPFEYRFEAVGIFLGCVGLERIPRSSFSRSFVAITLLLFRVLVFSYTGIFLSFLMNPLMEKQIKTLDDLREATLNGHVKVTSFEFAMKSLLSSSSQMAQDLSSHIRKHPGDILRTVDIVKAIENGFAVIFGRQALWLNIYRNNKSEDQIFISEDCLKISFMSAASRKGFFLRDDLNIMMIKAIETGISKRIFDREMFRTFLKAMMHHQEAERWRPINILDLASAFLILIVGCLISFLVLCVEICVKEKSKLCTHQALKTAIRGSEE